ncbi:unnamed protein product, partial [Rodentolepis nana]|uniref:Uncharacterized protein n=1 Tax=Rodentolepis nana TaxID=102285 RepID=A0A0R3TI45_RODNA
MGRKKRRKWNQWKQRNQWGNDNQFYVEDIGVADMLWAHSQARSLESLHVRVPSPFHSQHIAQFTMFIASCREGIETCCAAGEASGSTDTSVVSVSKQISLFLLDQHQALGSGELLEVEDFNHVVEAHHLLHCFHISSTPNSRSI